MDTTIEAMYRRADNTTYIVESGRGKSEFPKIKDHVAVYLLEVTKLESKPSQYGELFSVEGIVLECNNPEVTLNCKVSHAYFKKDEAEHLSRVKDVVGALLGKDPKTVTGVEIIEAEGNSLAGRKIIANSVPPSVKQKVNQVTFEEAKEN